jgi:hypothetical protein
MSYHFKKGWLQGDPVKSHLFNAASQCFPKVESFLIHSVNHYYDKIENQKIKEDMKRLSREEVAHSEVHKRFNQILEENGYNTNFTNRVTELQLYLFKKLCGPKTKLALSVGGEHLTALLGKYALETNSLHDCEETLKKVWLWHCTEELDHREVIFEVYEEIGGEQWRRKICLLIITLSISITIFIGHLELLKKEKILFKKKTWINSAHFFFRKNTGVYSYSIKNWLFFFRKDFHPRKISLKKIHEEIKEIPIRNELLKELA